MRTENDVDQARPVTDHRPDQAAVGAIVGPEGGGGIRHRARDDGGRHVVEGMRQHRRRVNPFETVVAERQRLKERRRHGHRIDRRTDVVHETGKGQRFGSAPAADRRLGLVDDDMVTRLREYDRRGEAVGAGADNDRIRTVH